MASVKVRYSRGVRIVGVSHCGSGNRQRSIKTLGAGREGEAAAESCAATHRRPVHQGTYLDQQRLTFAERTVRNKEPTP